MFENIHRNMITLQFSSFAEMQQHAVAAFKPYNTRLVLRHGMTASAHMIKQRAVGSAGLGKQRWEVAAQKAMASRLD